MDPTGRYVLARPARGDSAWVIAVGTGKRIGTVATTWRADLPMVTSDGWIALVRARDVVLVDGETLRPERTVKGGASDAWLFVAWDGFRPRAAATDEPVSVTPDSSLPGDSLADSSRVGQGGSAGHPRADSVAAPRAPAAPREPAAPPRDSASAPPTGAGFTVQFTAVLSEQSARSAAQEIVVNGARPRVVATQRSGTTIYRVVLGPYATREEAERAARASGKPYWIYEGAP
jgi:cell division septation protein DedD